MIAGIDQIDKFRHLDPDSIKLIFWGEEFNLKAIVEEAQRLLPLLEGEAAKPHWEAVDQTRAEAEGGNSQDMAKADPLHP